MDNMPIISVSFCLSADIFDLDYVSETLGLQPTAARTRDSFRIKEIAHTEWYLEIIKEKCFAISIPFGEVVHLLDNKIGVINKLRKELGLDVIFVIAIKMRSSENPEIVLHPDYVSFAASINAEIGFDLYCYEYNSSSTSQFRTG